MELLSLLIGVLLLFSAYAGDSLESLNPQNPSNTGRKWDKFFLLVFRNPGPNFLGGYNGAWKALIEESFILTNYTAVYDSAQANYIAMLGGDSFGCGSSSDTVCTITQPNVIDLLENGGISWKMYAENYQPASDGDCDLDVGTWDDYIRNPFLSYQDIRGNINRCRKIKNHQSFREDLRKNDIPQFSFMTYNTYKQGDDSEEASFYIKQWINEWWTPFQDSMWKETLLMITFDKSSTSSHAVVAMFRTPCGAVGHSQTHYDHYSILRFVEENWGLGNLGQHDITSNNFAHEIVCPVPPPEYVPFKKFFFMMFENRGFSYVMNNTKWKSVIDESYLLTNYYGVVHPSQPNYIATLGGGYFSCVNDGYCSLEQNNLVDLMEEKSISWRMYAEDYQPGTDGNCSWSNTGYYSRSHNPFLSFQSVAWNFTRCQKITTHYQFLTDLQNNNLPQFSYYTPNNNNNSHNQGLDYSGEYLTHWLENWYYPYLDTVWNDTLLMITFDEDNYYDNNRVVAFFKTPCFLKGTSSDVRYDHYSMLRVVEEIFDLGDLGRNDTTANSFLPDVLCPYQKVTKSGVPSDQQPDSE